MLHKDAALSHAGSGLHLRSRYENFVGGEWVPPRSGRYLENISPFTGKKTCEIPFSTPADVELALQAAERARGFWKKAAPTWRAMALNKIADRMEANSELLAIAEGRETGRPMTENVGIVLAIDHFRYFAGRLRERAQNEAGPVRDEFPEGPGGEALHPAHYPILMAAWQLAPALAAGNCVVLKPAAPTPACVLVLADLIRDLLPPGVLNIVSGYGMSPAPEDIL
jgi:aldehyde dehydrogenase